MDEISNKTERRIEDQISIYKKVLNSVNMMLNQEKNGLVLDSGTVLAVFNTTSIKEPEVKKARYETLLVELHQKLK